MNQIVNLKVLIVCSVNSGLVAPFIKEQVEQLKVLGVETEYFYIKKKGIIGYLSELKKILKKAHTFQADIIHAHYGLSGLLANLQFTIPVVTTYHGSDINNSRVFPFSLLSSILSSHNIFVSEKNLKKTRARSKSTLLPCGINIDLFQQKDRVLTRLELNLEIHVKYVLFAGAFDNKVKNGSLAQAAIELLPNVKLIELKGYSREMVSLLMNAVDAVLMTSFTEGSPQFIKEAMACNCPIVSVPVGDVPEMITDLNGCYLAAYDAIDIACKIQLVLNDGIRSEGRRKIIKLGLDAETVAQKVLQVYTSVMTSCD